MKYPVYDESDLKKDEEDGNYIVSEFTEFISQLIDNKILDNEVEKGIIALVDAKGTSGLSEKQGSVLDTIISRYDGFECKICGEKIPLNEALDFEESDGLCNYHQSQLDKEND
jgi:hypothetical protein